LCDLDSLCNDLEYNGLKKCMCLIMTEDLQQIVKGCWGKFVKKVNVV
jgi:hypothetical protein